MPILSRQKLSGSDSGLPILVTATAAAGAQAVHTVQTTATNAKELLTIWMTHSATSGSSVLSTIEVTNGSSQSQGYQNLAANSVGTVHPSQFFGQQPFTGTDTTVYAFSSATGDFFVWGFVDRIATG